MCIKSGPLYIGYLCLEIILQEQILLHGEVRGYNKLFMVRIAT